MKELKYIALRDTLLRQITYELLAPVYHFL